MNLIFAKDHEHAEKPRYRVVPFSQSAHCCFVATVVDTANPQLIGEEHYRDSDGYLIYDEVCECFSDDDAVRIAEALNRDVEGDKS